MKRDTHFGLEHDYVQHAPHDSDNNSHDDSEWIDTIEDDGRGVGD